MVSLEFFRAKNEMFLLDLTENQGVIVTYAKSIAKAESHLFPTFEQRSLLCLIDEFARQCLVIEVAASMDAIGVQKVLARLFETHGAPALQPNGSALLDRKLSQALQHRETAFGLELPNPR